MTHRTLSLAARAVRDLRPRAYPVETEIRPDGYGSYPLDLRAESRQFRPGQDGVVTVPGPDGRAYFNPVSASLYALGQHTWAWHGREYRDQGTARFLAQARRLRLRQDADGGWRYPVAVRRYAVEPGWYSAMAQGLAVSVLLRAADLTQEQSYVDSAGAAAALMLRPVGKAGCADYDESGRAFLEECPSDPPCHILNGALFALIGLRELNGRAGHSAHLPVAQRLAADLQHFDVGYWSRYDLRFPAPATHAYHALHISLLEIAARLLADQTFSRTARRWRGYLRHPGYRLRAAAGKAWFVLGESRG